MRAVLVGLLLAAVAAVPAHATPTVGRTYTLRRGGSVCYSLAQISVPNPHCTAIFSRPRVTALAVGLPAVVWGIDQTPVEIRVPLPGQAPVVGWTWATFLRP